MRWSVEKICRTLSVPVPVGGDSSLPIAGCSIDSRTLRRGELYVALRGPHFDGHDFVLPALEAGAPAAIVDKHRLPSYPENFRSRLMGVQDTLVALQELARAVRREWGRPVLAITGSTGKTTTKEILAAMMATRFQVLRSEGNLNNEYGLPLSLLQLEPHHEAAVLELAMSHRGELHRLAEICEPNLGIVTNVAPVHLEFFSSVEEIALAKRELVEGLAGDDSIAVLNADDGRVKSFSRFCRGKVIFYGLDKRADFRANGIMHRGAAGMTFEVVNRAGRWPFRMPLLGEHNVRNALAAFAAASHYGVTPEAAADCLAASRPVKMRGELLHFATGFSVVNDCYNSNPVALESMIELVAHFSEYRRRALVAGEMKELGPTSGVLHRRCGERAARAGLEWVFGIAGDAAALVEGAIAAGLSPDRTHFFATAEEAARFFPEWIQPGDLLLVKGSRAVRVEQVIDALKTRYPLRVPNPRPEDSGAAREAS